MKIRKCRVRGCTRPVAVKVQRMCATHYKRFVRDHKKVRSLKTMRKWLRSQGPIRPKVNVLPVFDEPEATANEAKA